MVWSTRRFTRCSRILRAYCGLGADSGLFRLSQKASHKFERVPDIPAMNVQAIAQDAEGRLWIGGDRLFIVGSGEVHEWRLTWLHGNQITSIQKTSDGAVWVGTLNGLWQLRDHELRFVKAYFALL